MIEPEDAFKKKCDQHDHDWKQLRQHMGCDGSDLQQLIAAWDVLIAERDAVKAEVKRLALSFTTERTELCGAGLPANVGTLLERCNKAEAALKIVSEELRKVEGDFKVAYEAAISAAGARDRAEAACAIQNDAREGMIPIEDVEPLLEAIAHQTPHVRSAAAAFIVKHGDKLRRSDEAPLQRTNERQ